jgi:HSP20 family molecular chaperone IbpA
LNVTAVADSIIVEGSIDSKREHRHGTVCFSEFSERELFRQLPMPTQIDPDHVSGSLQDGILTITAEKVTVSHAKPAAAQSVEHQKGRTYGV